MISELGRVVLNQSIANIYNVIFAGGKIVEIRSGRGTTYIVTRNKLGVVRWFVSPTTLYEDFNKQKNITKGA